MKTWSKFRSPRLAVLTALLPVLALTVPAWGQTTIDTTGDPNKTQFVGYGKDEGTSTWGQTITAPTNGDTDLTDFTFTLNAPTSGQIQSSAYVFAWNSTTDMATGSALFTSSPFDLKAGSGNNQLITINTGNLNLNAGQQYVLFFSLADPTNYAASTGDDTWVTDSDNPYSGGQFVFLRKYNNPSAWTNSTWGTNFAQYDLSFKADFAPAPVPEASTLVSFGGTLGMGGLAVLRRRRLKRAEPVPIGLPTKEKQTACQPSSLTLQP